MFNELAKAKMAETYKSNWEYITDELKFLDLLISLKVTLHQNHYLGKNLESFKGLALSDEEINDLLENANSFDDENLLNHNKKSIQKLLDTLNKLREEIDERRNLSLQQQIYLSLPQLSRIFHLARFEEQCIILCLAPEINSKYNKLYAYLQDDLTLKKPCIDLALSLFCKSGEEKLNARISFEQQSPIQKYHLIQVTENPIDYSSSLLMHHLKLDNRITNFLLDLPDIDHKIEPVAKIYFPKDINDQALEIKEAHKEIKNFIVNHFKSDNSFGHNIILNLFGTYGSGRHQFAKIICNDLGIPLIKVDLEKIISREMNFEETIWCIGREVVLQSSALCLENFDFLINDENRFKYHLEFLIEAIQTFTQLTFLLGKKSWNPQVSLNKSVFIDVEFPVPNDIERKKLWEKHLNGHLSLAPDIDLNELSGKFKFTEGQIINTLEAAYNLTLLKPDENSIVCLEDLHAACKNQSNKKLRTLAQKIETKYTWDDIVLPSDQKVQLQELCNQAKYRKIVYSEWGFDKKLSLGKGLHALFSGPSGTGKTMAAEIIANELMLDLYKIDLSQVVSKYIGETEKNLDKIFTEARYSNAILFFDEADALFGKRSEVKDAHDRYANIEIGYLLQKMEEYDGIAILTTNLRQNMDEAFARRIKIVVEFPFPDEEYRKRIWQIVFPGKDLIGKELLDKEVNFDLLAHEVKLPGGNIKNIALNAAFYAAKKNEAIGMGHLKHAVRREYQKMGRIWNEAGWN